MKKGQGLSLNTIVIAAIVLIVFVVLVAIFGGKLGDADTAMQDKKQCLCSNLVGNTVNSATIDRAQCFENDPEGKWNQYQASGCKSYMDCGSDKDCYIQSSKS